MELEGNKWNKLTNVQMEQNEWAHWNFAYTLHIAACACRCRTVDSISSTDSKVMHCNWALYIHLYLYIAYMCTCYEVKSLREAAFSIDYRYDD